MGTESASEPRTLVWLSGFILGMATLQAQGFYEAARAEVEPTAGRLAGVAAGGAAFAAWLGLMFLFVGWFCRREWVRDWFAAAERTRPPGPTT